MSTSAQPQTQPQPPNTYSIDAVAAAFKVLPSTVNRWAREGRIPAVKIEKQYYILQADFDALMEGRFVVQQVNQRITVTNTAAELVQHMAHILDLPPFVVVEVVIREAAERLEGERETFVSALRNHLQPEP